MFYFDLKRPYSPPIAGVEIKLPFFNPFRLSVNMVGYAFIFVVPCLYYNLTVFICEGLSITNNKNIYLYKLDN